MKVDTEFTIEEAAKALKKETDGFFQLNQLEKNMIDLGFQAALRWLIDKTKSEKK